ncbi:MAG: hypothetical protein ABR538_03025 [Candidatus Binatia bacterium]
MSSAKRNEGDGGTTARRGYGLAALAFSVATGLGLLEVALRVVPQAIPPSLLLLFEPGLRADIAAGSYPLQKDFREVPRDDGGPPLFVAKPESPIVSIDETKNGAERVTDEVGFCNPAGRYHGRERIELIALGDSFSWCHAVVPQRAWPALLEEKTGLLTFSLGRGGTGPYEYVQFLREFGLPKRPRVVILNIYGGNDLRDAAAWRDHRDALRSGRKPPSKTPDQVAPGLVASALGRHSYALNLVLAAVSLAVHDDPRDAEKEGIDFGYQVLLPSGPVEFNVENRDRDEVVSARHLQDGSTPLEIWDEALARFGALARERGFTAVVSYTPSAWAAYAGRVGLADPTLGEALDNFDAAQRRHLAERAAADGYLFHDLSADLQEAAAHADASGLLYDPVHVHLSERGNEVVAESLARFLAGKGVKKSL